MKYSVIVPIYKIEEKCLRACLNSLKAQSVLDAEFIVVDDGSPDQCGVICDSFCNDSRFRIIHQENSGVGSARNAGLNNAQGNLVLFVDGDDRVSETLLADLDVLLSGPSFDVAFFGYRRIDVRSELKTINLDNKSSIPDARLMAKAIASGGDWEGALATPYVVYGTPWGKVFRREFLEAGNIRFPVELRKRQDSVFMLDVLSREPAVVFVPIIGYGYVQRSDSVCHRYRQSSENDMMTTFDSISRLVRLRYPYSECSDIHDALNTLAVELIFEFAQIDCAHPDCPLSALEADHVFKELCKRYRAEIERSSPKLLPGLAWAMMSVALKLRCYSVVFLVLKMHAKRHDTRL